MIALQWNVENLLIVGCILYGGVSLVIILVSWKEQYFKQLCTGLKSFFRRSRNAS